MATTPHLSIVRPDPTAPTRAEQVAGELLGEAERLVRDQGTELLIVDPRSLVLGPNVRREDVDEVTRDRGFLASLRQIGVLSPIVCARDEDGRLVVLMGKRRTIGAVHEQLPAVPVLVRPMAPSDIDRVFEQLAENDQRADVSTADRVAAVGQLAAFGVPASVIAARGGYEPRDVDHALAVARSPVAVAAAAEHPALPFAAAAAIAEFDDDPAVVAEITAAAEAGQSVEHITQRARDHRRDEAERSEVIEQLRADGWTVHDGHLLPVGAQSLARLGVSVAAHRRCQGHAAIVTLDPDAHVDGRQEPAYVPLWFCADPIRYGHAGQPAQRGLDDEAAAQDRRARDAGNREWRSAEQVRRRWLRDVLAARKTPPDGAGAFIVRALLRCDASVARAMERTSQHRLARDLLGLDRTGYDHPGEPHAVIAASAELRELLDKVGVTRGRDVVLALFLIVCAWDERTSVQTWQQPTAQDARYLAALAGWGYDLAPIERRLIDSTETSYGPGS